MNVPCDLKLTKYLHMKHLYPFFFSIIIFFNTTGVFSFATNPVSPGQKEVANQWLAAQPVRFMENNGQMTDTDNEPVPFVLFKASAPGMDVYLTEKGLTRDTALLLGSFLIGYNAYAGWAQLGDISLCIPAIITSYIMKR